MKLRFSCVCGTEHKKEVRHIISGAAGCTFCAKLAKQTNPRTRSLFLSALDESAFTLVGELPHRLSTNSKVVTRCKCGDSATRRVSDIIAGAKQCYRCAAIDRDAGATLLTADGRSKYNPKKYLTEYEEALRQTMASAKQRCQTPSYTGYHRYGGRGIQFNFPSVYDAVVWVRDNLGERPDGYTLDRIDNDGHYEPGNLRWADRRTQRLNQAEHERRTTQGIRVDRLHAQRPDVSRETIRRWVADKGMTDDEVLANKKGKHQK